MRVAGQDEDRLTSRQVSDPDRLVAPRGQEPGTVRAEHGVLDRPVSQNFMVDFNTFNL